MIVEQQEQGQLEVNPKTSPSADLFVPSGRYVCRECAIPLMCYTRIIGRVKDSGEQFQNYCVACFAVGLKGEDEGERKEFQYFTVAPYWRRIEGTNLTEVELIALYQCVEKYGVDNWTLISEQFAELSGKRLSSVQLSETFVDIYNKLKDQFSLQKHPDSNISQERPKKKIGRFEPSFERYRDDFKKHAQQFYKILHYFDILQVDNSPSDEHWGYLLDLLCEYKAQDYSTGWVEEMSEQAKAFLYFAKKWCVKSVAQHNKSHKIHKHLCNIYYHMCIRQSRKTRQLLPFQEKPKNIELIQHTELAKLKKMPNIDINAIIQQVQSLKERRQKLKAKSRILLRHPSKSNLPIIWEEPIREKKLIAKKTTSNSKKKPTTTSMEVESISVDQPEERRQTRSTLKGKK